LGVDITGQMPHDPAGVARLAETPNARTVGRTALLRAARSLAATLIERLEPPSESPPSESLAPDDDTVEPSATAESESGEPVREETRS
jgi:hypothetical protein